MALISTKFIGYFRPAGEVVYTESDNRWPIIKKMDLSGTPDKEVIARYLDNGHYARGYRGWSQFPHRLADFEGLTVRMMYGQGTSIQIWEESSR